MKAARKVKLLTALSWPQRVEAAFFAAKAEALPDPPPVATDLASQRAELVALRDAADRGDPRGAFLAATAASYIDAVDLLRAAGTPEFVRLSRRMYGAPDMRIGGADDTFLDAAEHHLDRTRGFASPPAEQALGAEEAAVLLRGWLAERMTRPPRVELDAQLTSLATAGSKRIRLRGTASFTHTQLEQLLQHEAMVHSATAQNGRAQPELTSLSLGAPRTTATQEGLATFAELITDTMDLRRLRRIALRVRALAAALDGADFLQIYRLFREEGYGERESFRSAARVFRGGDVRGGVAFTKDCVYLRGLVEVHAFLLLAAREGRPELVRSAFIGRLTLGDAVRLAPLVEAGTLREPEVMPAWARRVDRLAAYLVVAGFSTRIDLDALTLTDFA